MSHSHHGEGSVFPPLQPDILRLYSMFFSPFAQRTRMVLAHKKIRYDIVNINLADKPQWFLDRNPFGFVPILEQNDCIIYGSSICDDYLDELYPEDPLVPKGPNEKAKQKMLMECFAKVTSSFYTLIKSLRSEDGQDQSELLEKLRVALQPFEDVLKDTYLGGSNYSMLDIHAWPFIERFGIVEMKMKQEVLCPERFPKLCQWVTDMKQTEPVNFTGIDNESHINFFMSMPDYEIILKE